MYLKFLFKIDFDLKEMRVCCKQLMIQTYYIKG